MSDETKPQPDVAAATDEQIEDERRAATRAGLTATLRLIRRIDELRAEKHHWREQTRLSVVRIGELCDDCERLTTRIEAKLAELEAVTGPTLGCCGRYAVEHEEWWSSSNDCLGYSCPGREIRETLRSKWPPEYLAWRESRSNQS